MPITPGNIQVGVNTADLAMEVAAELTTGAADILALQTNVSGSAATGLTAAGSTQGTALLLAACINIVTTAAASTGVRLPANVIGRVYFIANRGANPITVYPPTSGTIDGGAANAGVALAANAATRIAVVSSTAAFQV